MFLCADDASDGHAALCRLAGLAARLLSGDGPHIRPGHSSHEVRRTAGTFVILPSNKQEHTLFNDLRH